ncbi:hypothetical protein R3P38DRAFT_1768568 [Favolaschia claudopus]|uniref:Uncharacterized protein n=1 Tax=Favolaschia claudopus TaxID=2862362 RepID=A0AAW0A782_9AGAR
MKVTARLPDGSGEVSFNYVSHTHAEHAEYKIISDVTEAMGNTDSEHLHCLSREQWLAMSVAERVNLWREGYDIYIEGLTSGNAIPDMRGLRAEVTRDNAMDASVEVQVQALRRFARGEDDAEADIDHTAAIMETTLDEMLEEMENPAGLVLNGLNLTSGGHMVHHNPLLDTGFDLESKAYGKTNGVLGMPTKHLDYAEFHFNLVGRSHVLSLFHTDISMTRICVLGPGWKFWSRSWEKIDTGPYNINDSRAFDAWEPDTVNVETHHYTVTALRPGHGILLQQPGRRHAVFGVDGEFKGAPQQATLTRGGYFLCASRMRESVSVFLHIIMQPHLLTNAEHIALWPVYIRVCMFWMHSTMDRSNDLPMLEGYVPSTDLNNVSGWLDIVYVACLIILQPCLDLRVYEGDGTPDVERDEGLTVLGKYRLWREWLGATFACSNESGDVLDMEHDVLSGCLVHMAATLLRYHEAVGETDPTAEIFKTYTTKKFRTRLRSALKSYDSLLPARMDAALDSLERGRFYKFDGKELRFSRRSGIKS